MPKWIDLNDASGARLKIATIPVEGEEQLHLFITNLSHQNQAWKRAVNELGFVEGVGRRYLVRLARREERATLAMFRPIFPNAKMAELPTEQYMLNGQTARGRGFKSATAEERAVSIDLTSAVQLGRNADGDRVFETAGARYIVKLNAKGEETRQRETDSTPLHAVLRLPKLAAVQVPSEVVAQQRAEALLKCTDGFVRSMVLGEVQHSEDSERFMRAVYGAGPYSVDQHDEVHAAIETSLVRYLRDGFEVAQDAYGEAARLTDLLPPYRGHLRGGGTMAAPISVVAQRLLGDTAGKTVVVPNAFDGAAFAFLPEGTTVRAYRGTKDLSRLSHGINLRASAEWQEGDFNPAHEVGADALLINADPSRDAAGGREDFASTLASLRALKDGGRAVVVLAADGTPGTPSAASRTFLKLLGERYEVQGAFETAPILSRKLGVEDGSPGLRVISLVNRKPATPAPVAATLPLISSWDELKSHVDDLMVRAEVMDAEAQGIDIERAAQAGRVQRPYIAFSRVGEARSMVPANMQAPMQAMMTRIERLYGSVDELVMREMGWSWAMLNERLSPEQVDGVASIMVRHLEGRGHILADDTGIGKGRQLAVLVAWALKRNRPVFFVTDKANLFSDLARDLKDIGEWDRLRPMVLNSDGDITWDPAPGAPSVTLASATSPAIVKRMVEEGTPLEDGGYNIAFLTYSQIAVGGVDSEKAQWIKNQLGPASLFFDEAHIAAGSDSQIAGHVAEMGSLAASVQYASATWAKSEDNLHIFAPAFPESVNVASLAAAIKKGGESFSEVLSGMLCAEGALMRREHDLSKLDVSVYIDQARKAENERVSDAVAAALGAATYLAGDLNAIFSRGNRDVVKVLRAAREAREAIMSRENNVDGAPRRSGNILSSSFGTGSVLYQTMKAVQGALNAEQVADRVIEQFQAGLKPVIVSEATNEALTRLLLERSMDMSIRPGKNGKRPLPTHTRMPTIRDAVREVLMPRLSTVVEREITEDDVEPESEALAPGDRRRRAAPAPLGGRNAEPLDADDTAEAPDLPDGVEVGGGPAGEAGPADRDREAIRRIEAQDDPDEEAVSLDDAIEQAQRAPTVVKARRRLVSVLDLPGLSDEERTQYKEGMDQLERLIAAIPPLPVSAFDVMQHRLRAAGIRVSEITGRSFQLIHDPTEADQDRWRVVPRMRSKRAVNAVKRAFNNGEIDILTINRSAATGASMHASPRFLDQKRRVLVEHQIPEDPTNRIQLIGRVNRWDQVSFPLVETSCTGVPGELRYVMMQNRKLAKMSANVRSSRENAMLAKDVPDLYNTIGIEAIKSYIQDEPLVARKLALPDNFIDSPGPTLVNSFLMRIPLLPTTEQLHVYDQIFMRFEESFNRYELAGSNPLKTSEYDWRAREVSRSVFFGDPSGQRENAMQRLFAEDAAAEAVESDEETVAEARAAITNAANAAAPGADVDADGQLNMAALVAPAGAGAAAEEEAGEGTDDLLGEFDRPVFIRKIQFEEDLKPFTWGAVIATITGSRELLQQNGHHELDEQGVLRWKPDVVARLNAGMAGIAKLAQTAGGFVDYKEAVTKSKAVERAHLRAHWLAEHIEFLLPGSRFAVQEKEHNFAEYRDGVIIDVKLPSEVRDLIYPHKWKVSVAFAGEERPAVYSLQALLSGVRGEVRIGEVTGDLRTHAWAPLFPGKSVLDVVEAEEPAARTRPQIGRAAPPTLELGDFEEVDLEPRPNLSNARFKAAFENAPTGLRRREAYVLDGNMYLAYDWAVKSKLGKSIIYTDDKGLRQRGVLLPNTMTRIAERHMPVRVWGKQLTPFVQGLMERKPGGTLRLCTTFQMASGMDWGMAVIPGEKGEITYLAKAADARRMAKLMRGAQAKIRAHELGEDATAGRDPLNIPMRVISKNGARKGGKNTLNALGDNDFDVTEVASAQIPSGMVAVKMKLDPTDPAKLGRAIEILSKAVGLELYAVGEERAVAREVGRAHFASLREESAARRAQVRDRMEAPTTAARARTVPAATSDANRLAKLRRDRDDFVADYVQPVDYVDGVATPCDYDAAVKWAEEHPADADELAALEAERTDVEPGSDHGRERLLA